MGNGERICYRKIDKYKYQSMYEYTHETRLQVGRDVRTEFDFVRLSASGHLATKKYYAWDGPSGPSIDTKNFMRGSLVHDALYQLMREGLIDEKKFRKDADVLLRAICREDGMSKVRAWYVYWIVRAAGWWSARPRPKPPTCTWAPSSPPDE